MAKLRRLRDAAGQVLDDALVISFAAHESVTGEPLVEFHCHGGRAVVRAVEAALCEAGAQRAEAGAFTRRAFTNGRIDINQVEGLSDLLAAETETQRRAAIAMTEGHFSKAVSAIERHILDISAHVEALIDFSDEDDVAATEGSIAPVKEALAAIINMISVELRRPHARPLKEGLRVVIAGPPNAGKSTLINALAGRDVAIVSDVAGTTRDRIEAPVQLGGIAFTLIDTAGLRTDSIDPIEMIGVALSQNAIRDADIICWLGDGDDAPGGAIRVRAKADLGVSGAPAQDGTSLAVSAVTGAGMDALAETLIARARDIIPRDGGYVLSERQMALLHRCQEAITAVQGENDLLIIAEGLRIARNACDALTGRSGTEAMLDRLFAGFCIGK